MSKTGVTYAVRALLTSMGYGHLSVHTQTSILGKYVTTVIVGKDRRLRLKIASAMREKWLHSVSQKDNGAVLMVSPKEWHVG